MAARWPIWGGSAWRRCRRRSRWGSWPRRWRRGRGGWNWWSRGSITEERSLHHCCNLAEHQKLLALNLTSPHYIFTAEELVTVDEHSGNVTKEKENFFLLFLQYKVSPGNVAEEKDNDNTDKNWSQIQFLLGRASWPFLRKPEILKPQKEYFHGA